MIVKDLGPYAYGEHWEIPLSFTDAEGLPLDATGATITWRLANADAVVMNRVVGDGITLDDPVNGKRSSAMLVVTPAMQLSAVNLKRGMYDYGVQLVFPDTTVSIQAAGTFNVEETVFTRFL